MTLKEFLESEDWELYCDDTHPDDCSVEDMYQLISDKPSCVECYERFDDLGSYYDAAGMSGAMSGHGKCIHCQ